MEGVEEDGEDVLFGRAVVLLLHGEGVEEEIGGEHHQKVLLGADAEGPGAMLK